MYILIFLSGLLVGTFLPHLAELSDALVVKLRNKLKGDQK